MGTRFWIAAGLLLFTSAAVGWIVLTQRAGWPATLVWISAAPLLLSWATLLGLSPKAYFYAALTLMLYIAFAITQIVVAPATRLEAALMLACGLLYLTILKFVLQALNARRQA